MAMRSHARLLRATVVASAWLLALTMLNVLAGGTVRQTIFFAVPVAFAAWHDLRLGLVFAAVGATGRATGPHLHWGMNWFDVRIDPLLVLELAK